MLVRKIRNRGANVVVEAHGEVLFAPGSDLSRWKTRFSNRITTQTAIAAPSNKRPRWGHYGKALKTTFTSSTSTRITKGGGFFYIAVGSTAPHAYYVDQGTGVYAGRGAYQAKVLPPWQRGEASLYEHTWRPGGPGTKRVAPVWIKGQRPQGFFDTGLKRGFQSMQMRSYQVPGEGASGMRGALSSFPTGLANFKGNTAADAGFETSLHQWRAWRDEAWGNNSPLGRRIRPERRKVRFLDNEMRTNIAAYRASLAAAQRRRQAQVAALRAQRERQAEAEARRRERETKAQTRDRISRGNVRTKREALLFLQRIKSRYPNAALDQTRLADGVMVYQVRYTLPDGRRVSRLWAYGYGGQVKVT